ncbi:MAG: cytochrome c biogenesis protein/redoxin, partial [Terriglobia bacterium]
VVFVGMGASASAVGGFLIDYKSILYKIAGVIIIFFGVFLLGLIKIPTLYREKRYHGQTGTGKVGTFLLGLAFAFGWTPCIGPILGALLLLAATKETVTQGVFLLSLYSLGLGVPFFLTAIGLNKFLSFYQGFRRHLLWVERTAGVLLIAVGLLVASNQLTWLSSYFGAFATLDGLLQETVAGDELGSIEVNVTPEPERPFAPAVVLPTRDGGTFNLSEYQGQVVVVNFWASWCAPCRLEIPFFNKTFHEYQAQGVQFVGISVDAGGWSDVEEFQASGTPIEYLVALDENQSTAEGFGGLPGLPVTVFLDRQGRIAYKHIGITDIDTLKGAIEALR